MSGITYTLTPEVFAVFPHLVVKNVALHKADYTCNITGAECLSARGAITSSTEVLKVIPMPDIPGCRVNCQVFTDNLKKA